MTLNKKIQAIEKNHIEQSWYCEPKNEEREKGETNKVHTEHHQQFTLKSSI